MLQIGVVGESGDNIEVGIEWCRKILRHKNIKVKIRLENRFDLNTKVTLKNLQDVKKHFEKSTKKPALLVIFTDRDERKQIRNKIQNEAKSLFSFPVVLAIPVEIIENWIISDTGTLNNVLDVKIKNFPKKNVDAKNWIKDVIGRSGSDLNTPTIYKKIAINQNFNLMSNDFDDFRKDLVNAVNDLMSNKLRINKKVLKRSVKRV